MLLSIGAVVEISTFPTIFGVDEESARMSADDLWAVSVTIALVGALTVLAIDPSRSAASVECSTSGLGLQEMTWVAAACRVVRAPSNAASRGSSDCMV